MSDLSNAQKKAVVDHLTGNGTYTAGPWYLALFTTMPDAAGAGGVEVSGSGYARQAVTFGAGNSTGLAENTSTHTFTASGGNFGTILGVGYYSASTSGTFKGKQTITSQVVNSGQSIIFAAGDLDLQG